MSFLLYCIMRDPPVECGEMAGMYGQPVSFVVGEGLCAAVSRVEQETGHEETMPPVSELLVYARVVEELCNTQTVIPMRYGCFLEGLPEIRHSLHGKAKKYAALLVELDGCIEMGIRFFLPVHGRKPQTLGQEAPENRELADGMRGAVTRDAPSAVNGQTPGISYLAERREQYRIREENSRRDRRILDACVLEYSELKARYRSGSLTTGACESLSLDFLIRKNQVARFREIFRLSNAPVDIRKQISGPWPPYTFVFHENAEGSMKGEDDDQDRPG